MYSHNTTMRNRKAFSAIVCLRDDNTCCYSLSGPHIRWMMVKTITFEILRSIHHVISVTTNHLCCNVASYRLDINEFGNRKRERLYVRGGDSRSPSDVTPTY